MPPRPTTRSPSTPTAEPRNRGRAPRARPAAGTRLQHHRRRSAERGLSPHRAAPPTRPLQDETPQRKPRLTSTKATCKSHYLHRTAVRCHPDASSNTRPPHSASRQNGSGSTAEHTETSAPRERKALLACRAGLRVD